jgi:hypothetical protein
MKSMNIAFASVSTCPVSQGSLTPKVRSSGSFSIHFAARKTLHFPDPHADLPIVGLSLGLNPAWAWNRELPNGLHPGGAHCILDAEDQDIDGDPRQAVIMAKATGASA